MLGGLRARVLGFLKVGMLGQRLGLMWELCSEMELAGKKEQRSAEETDLKTGLQKEMA